MKLITHPNNRHLIENYVEKQNDPKNGVLLTKFEVVFNKYMPEMRVKSYKPLNERFVEYEVCDWTIYCGFVVPDVYEPLFYMGEEQRSVFNSIDGPKYFSKSPKKLIDRCW